MNLQVLCEGHVKALSDTSARITKHACLISGEMTGACFTESHVGMDWGLMRVYRCRCPKGLVHIIHLFEAPLDKQRM
jgi:hypothetical protein